MLTLDVLYSSSGRVRLSSKGRSQSQRQLPWEHDRRPSCLTIEYIPRPNTPGRSTGMYRKCVCVRRGVKEGEGGSVCLCEIITAAMVHCCGWRSPWATPLLHVTCTHTHKHTHNTHTHTHTHTHFNFHSLAQVGAKEFST